MKEVIESLKRQAKKAKEIVKTCEGRIEAYSTCEQIETKTLYEGMLEVISFTISKGKYKYILGGDGRSQPWDETREGDIYSVTISDGLLISNDQKKIIVQYFVNTNNINSEQVEFLNPEKIITDSFFSI